MTQRAILILGLAAGNSLIHLATVRENDNLPDGFQGDEYDYALSLAESATAQGRANSSFVIIAQDAFFEAERPWANPDNASASPINPHGFTHNYPAEAASAAPVALNPGSGEQPIPFAEAEAGLDGGTETLQANRERGLQDGNASTAGANDKSPLPKPDPEVGKSVSAAEALGNSGEASKDASTTTAPAPAIDPLHAPTAKSGVQASNPATAGETKQADDKASKGTKASEPAPLKL